MPGSFLDSNTVLYRFSSDDRKVVRARLLLAAGATISVQVLNEVANVARKKLQRSWDEIDEISAMLRSVLTIVDLTPVAYILGLKLARRYGFSIYGSMIVATALEADCDTLWSEDMHDGLIVDDGLTIRNPF